LSWGSYRDAYLSPSGVVYKVQHYEYGDHEANLCEARAIARGMRIPEYVPWLPAAALYYSEYDEAPIMAMEYVTGVCVLSDQEHEVAKKISEGITGTYDLDVEGSQHNAARRTDGQPVLIDLGGYGSTQAMQSVA
jgi:hypothetical protein